LLVGVPTSEVSEMKSVEQARRDYTEAIKRERYFWLMSQPK